MSPSVPLRVGSGGFAAARRARGPRSGRVDRLAPRAAPALLVLLLVPLAALAGCRSAPRGRPATPVADDSTSGRLLLRGDELMRAGDLETAARAYQRCVDEAVRERNSSNLVEALAQLAEIGRLVGDGSGEIWLLDAQDRADEEEPLGWSRLLLVEGRFALEEGRHEKAQAIFRDLFEYCVEHELYDRALDAAHRLALTGPVEHRIEWSERGIGLAEDLRDEPWQAVLWNNLGWVYTDADRREEALEAFLRARELHAVSGTPEQRLAADYSVGRAYRVLGDLPDALDWLGATHRRAEERYERDPSPENARWLGLTQLELAELAADLGAGPEAAASLRRAHQLLLDSGAETWWPEGLQRIEDRLTAGTKP